MVKNNNITDFELIKDKEIVALYIKENNYNFDINNILENTNIIVNNNNHVGVVTINEIDDYKGKHIEIKNLYIEYDTLYLIFMEFILKRNVNTLCLFIKNKESKIYKEIGKSNLICYLENNKIIIFNSNPKRSILIKTIVVDVCIGFVKEKDKESITVRCNLSIKKLNKNYYLFIKDKILSLNCDANIMFMEVSLNNKTLYHCNNTKYSKIIDNNIFEFFINGIKLSEIQMLKYFKYLHEIILYKDHTCDNKENLGYLYIIQRKDFVEENQKIYKIGCTQNMKSRTNQYPKGSIVIFSIYVKNFRSIEKIWIKLLDNNYRIKKRHDFGNEYYDADKLDLINVLMRILNEK